MTAKEYKPELLIGVEHAIGGFVRCEQRDHALDALVRALLEVALGARDRL